ncbi:MAG TPA: HlyD family secretion protein [Sneathiellales bacterium]|nr:HlyD family secretion protein [Sneathiellales bacterium]
MTPSRKPILVAVLLIATAVAGIAVAQWWMEVRFHESTNNAYISGDITAFSPKVSGYVKEVLVSDNQLVQKGDVLVIIEDLEYAAKVERAQAAVTRAQAGLVNIEQRRLLQAALIDEAEAYTDAHQADLERTTKDLDRARQLVSDGWVSKQGEDYATTDELRARATLASSQAATSAAKQRLVVLDSEKHQLLAEVSQAEADLRLAKIDLRSTVMRAPTSGTVGNRRVRAGEYVRPGTRLLALVPLQSVWVVANFKETQLTHMRPGNIAEVTVDTFPSKPFRGVVDSISPASGAEFSLLPPENATGNFTKVVQRIPVKIVLPADNPLIGRLAPGMSVYVTVDTHSGDASAADSSRKAIKHNATKYNLSEIR